MSSRDPGLDCLRGLSILLVVAYHYTTRFDHAFLGFDSPLPVSIPGYIGVDIFFIVSAFCIALTLDRSPTFRDFLAARLSRIQPAYMVAICLTFLAMSLFSLPEREVTTTDFLWNFVWGNGIPFWADHIDLAYWSLIVELKFYVLYGLLCTIVGSPSWRVAGWSLVVLIGAATSMAGNGEYAAQILLIHPHSAMFLVGLFLYYEKKLTSSARVLAVLSVALSLAVADRYANTALFGSAIFVAVFFIMFRKTIDIKFLSFAGMISYSWYLIHQNIGVIAIRELNDIGLQMLSIPLAFGFSFLIAVAINRLVEFRFRKNFAKAFALLLHPLGLLEIKHPEERKAMEAPANAPVGLSDHAKQTA